MKPFRTLFAALLLTALAAGAVMAQNDQDNTNHTGWTWLRAQSVSQVGKYLSTNDGRITDVQVIKVASTGKPVLDTVIVSNTGTYGKTWYWYYGITPEQVVSYGLANNLRPIAIAPYFVGNSLYVVVVFISNTGADAAAWDLYYGGAAAVVNAIRGDGARPLNFKAYGQTGTTSAGYIGIGVQNDSRQWQALWESTPAQINAVINSGFRPTQLGPDSGGKFTSVLDTLVTDLWWEWYNSPEAATWGLATWVSARPLCIAPSGPNFCDTFISN